MDFLTEEELFELQHQDEMDAIDDMDVPDEIECIELLTLYYYKIL